jgi:serine/threonine protein kinase
LVNYIVIELAAGGELFNLIAQTGRFDEDLSRYYFQKMVDAIYHCHQQGVSHRDLKPENIMLDQKWDLKIIDFGLAAPTQGRDGSGMLKTTLGTYGYMAPEQHLGREYEGEKVDIFALGVILFVMYSKHPPFNAAIPKDQFYVAIASKNYKIFWEKHSQHKKEGNKFFSESFKDLFQRMTELDPANRISIDEIRKHPWYTEPTHLDQPKVQQIFERRFEQLN